ncbi:hypothetical protein BHE74_00019123, partial [Ensete ventricosum]
MIATWPNRIRCSARSDERGCGRLRSAAVTRARRGPDVTAVSRLMWLAVGTATARVSTRETWAFGELSEGGSGSRGPTGTRHPTRRQTSDESSEAVVTMPQSREFAIKDIDVDDDRLSSDGDMRVEWSLSSSTSSIADD